MQTLKKSLIIGAGVVTLGAGSLGVVSAATNSTSTPDDTLVSKIASTFNLDKSKVQAVFDANRADHEKAMQEKRAAALKQAVTDGKITQAQADYITKAWADIDAQRPTDGTKPTTAQRDAMKVKMDALRTWEKQQNLDLKSIAGLDGPGGHGRGGPGKTAPDSDKAATSSTTTE